MADWMCESGHRNEDAEPSVDPYCSYGPCLGMLAYELEAENPPGPYIENVDDVDCDPEQPPEGAECPGPHVHSGGYQIDETQGKVKKTTSKGKIRQFSLPTANKNSTDRPEMPRFIIRKASELVTFEGAKGTKKVHQAVVEKLKEMVDAMKAEGERIDDRSLKEVVVQSPWRDPATEGKNYLKNVKANISRHANCHKDDKGCVAGDKFKGNNACPKGFEKMSFPSSLETEAKSELGKKGSSKWKTFQTNLGKASGWTSTFAKYVLKQTGRWKAPAGGSPHHSGLVVDLNWPIWTGKGVELHGMSSKKNSDARKSSAGIWLNKHAATFGFKSYNEAEEIWHMEWVDWKGSTADPF